MCVHNARLVQKPLVTVATGVGIPRAAANAAPKCETIIGNLEFRVAKNTVYVNTQHVQHERLKAHVALGGGHRVNTQNVQHRLQDYKLPRDPRLTLSQHVSVIDFQIHNLFLDRGGL